MEDEKRSPERAALENRLTEESDDLLTTSDDLLTRIRELRKLEERKRRTGISSAEFHRLADEVEQRSREIWQLAEQEASLASGESETGERTGAPTDRTLDAVDVRRHLTLDEGPGGFAAEDPSEDGTRDGA